MANSGDPSSMVSESSTMDNIYREWTEQDDRILYDNRNLSTVKLASLLGRGLQGVDARLKKLTTVESPAYLRLFGDGSTKGFGDDEHATNSGEHSASPTNEKLTPVKEVLRRIQWDPVLQTSSFSIIHYDRMDDSLCETNFDAPNDSISGREVKFVFALPEHRIQGVKYLDRVVWDIEKRIDCVFGSTNGRTETIDRVIETYDVWKRDKERRDEIHRKRYMEIIKEMTEILGEDGAEQLRTRTISLTNINANAGAVKEYVKFVRRLYYEATRIGDIENDDGISDDEDSSEQDETLSFMYLFSELIALLPGEHLREASLGEIESVIHRLSKNNVSSAGSKSKQTNTLPQLREEDLEESFVRGSGAGGQKINKTSNKVILLHIPTQLRVECQDTRSLQQNRKIARKRLQLKIDDLLNGDTSRNNQKASIAVAKKTKNKARNKRRQMQKMEDRDAVDNSDTELC